MAQAVDRDCVIGVERRRYDELIAKEERLRMLEKAISESDYWNNISQIKSVFGLINTDKKGKNEK